MTPTEINQHIAKQQAYDMGYRDGSDLTKRELLAWCVTAFGMGVALAVIIGALKLFTCS